MPGVKGKTNNPNGRPTAGNAFVEQLRDALDVVGKKKGKSLMQHAVEEAYRDNVVLVALMRKLIPDLSETDIGQRTFEYFQKQIDKYQK